MTARIPLLAVSFTLFWAFHCSADTLEGKLLDVPRRYPDGSIRFHVLPDGRQTRAWEPVRISASAHEGSIRFSDRFQGGRDARWLDVVGRTEARDWNTAQRNRGKCQHHQWTRGRPSHRAGAREAPTAVRHRDALRGQRRTMCWPSLNRCKASLRCTNAGTAISDRTCPRPGSRGWLPVQLSGDGDRGGRTASAAARQSGRRVADRLQTRHTAASRSGRSLLRPGSRQRCAGVR